MLVNQPAPWDCGWNPCQLEMLNVDRAVGCLVWWCLGPDGTIIMYECDWQCWISQMWLWRRRRRKRRRVRTRRHQDTRAPGVSLVGAHQSRVTATTRPTQLLHELPSCLGRWFGWLGWFGARARWTSNLLIVPIPACLCTGRVLELLLLPLPPLSVLFIRISDLLAALILKLGRAQLVCCGVNRAWIQGSLPGN